MAGEVVARKVSTCPYDSVFAPPAAPSTEPLPDLHPDAWKAERMRRFARRHAGRTRQSRHLLGE